MTQSNSRNTTKGEESLHREYVLDVRIVEIDCAGCDGSEYRFEAPQHVGMSFEDADTAELYADVYFDTNGFQEAGTGDRGVPPEVIQAGKDTLAAYFLTQPGADVNWMSSFYGVEPPKIERYVAWVQERAKEIRAGIAEERKTLRMDDSTPAKCVRISNRSEWKTHESKNTPAPTRPPPMIGYAASTSRMNKRNGTARTPTSLFQIFRDRCRGCIQ